MRRWDSGPEIAIAQPAENGGWLGLEGGVEVHFEAGTYRSGDYWLIPARAFIGEFSGDIEWPQEGGNPAALPAHGVEHHFCKLAVVDFDAAAKKFSNPRDCRLLFPAVTELVHLFHVGGDGQEALPGQALPCPLEVGVTNGQWPLPGARVEFKASAGSLDVGLVQTNTGGVARCNWTLPAAPPDGRATCLTVTATLRDVAGNPVSIPVVFHAGLRLDFILSYVGGDGQEAGPKEMLPQPLEVRVANGRAPQAGAQVRFRVIEGKGQLGKDRTGTALAPELILQTDANGLAACFWTFGDDGADPRQRVEAVLLDGAGNPVLDQVVHFNAGHGQSRDAGVVIKRVTALADKKPLNNDSLVNLSRFLEGFQVETDQGLSDVFSFPPPIPGIPPFPFPSRPNFQVILHVPFPPGLGAGGSLSDGAGGVVGFQPLLLAGTVSAVDSAGVQWVPSDVCRRWFGNILFKQLNPNLNPNFRLLVQVILKGRFIWSVGDPDLFLDGEAFGRRQGKDVGLTLPSGDGRRGGDFEMWFWLVPDPAILNVNADGNLVVGSVLDQAGAPLPGIKITLLVPAAPRSAVTSASGNFSFREVPSGRFTVQAEIPGGPTLTKEVIVGQILVNPVLTNPVLTNPVLTRPAGPLGLAAEEPAAGARRLTDVRGIGRARAALLTGSGINTPADLAAVEPARLAEILGVSEETARTLVASARDAQES